MMFCVYPIVAKHFKMFFWDVDDQFFNEVQSMDGFSNSYFIALGTYEVLIMEYLTTVEMSERWNITSRRIGVLCAEGRVEGYVPLSVDAFDAAVCGAGHVQAVFFASAMITDITHLLIIKKGKTWLIPDTSEKPFDARRKENMRTGGKVTHVL